jgi:hypothetical protein
VNASLTWAVEHDFAHAPLPEHHGGLLERRGAACSPGFRASLPSATPPKRRARTGGGFDADCLGGGPSAWRFRRAPALRLGRGLARAYPRGS